ncbi:MAG TPA: MFS transporter, partial [Burkholderiales bacterium]|nr:MFS transporter [Burkholderiales bacterium]
MRIKYGWVMVAIGAFMTCIAIGAMFSLAVFLQPITQATGWSHTEVSSAMTIGFLAMGAAGFGWGALSDRIGPRYVVLAGAVFLGLGLAAVGLALFAATPSGGGFLLHILPCMILLGVGCGMALNPILL